MTGRTFRQAIREYVDEQKREGVAPETIADRVNWKWPGTNLTAKGVIRMGTTWIKNGEAREVRMPAPKPKNDGTCQYKFLAEGKLSVCGCAGYPYCERHLLKTSPRGSKFVFATRL